MTAFFNRSPQKLTRRALRNDLPKAEALLWAQLRCKQVAGVRFHRQSNIGSYIVDFYCPPVRLAIEVDGDSHSQPGAELADRRRQRFIEGLGIRVMRVSNTAVYENLDAVVEGIAAVVGGQRDGGNLP